MAKYSKLPTSRIALVSQSVNSSKSAHARFLYEVLSFRTISRQYHCVAVEAAEIFIEVELLLQFAVIGCQIYAP
jgi:hypothetical protein